MKAKKQKKNRFKIACDEMNNDGSGCRIIEDTETGINYLYYFDGLGGSGLTVLIDEEGEPLVAPEA
ncbi:MAG: DUF6440 family protein [Eubacteriaceae bacterium]